MKNSRVIEILELEILRYQRPLDLCGETAIDTGYYEIIHALRTGIEAIKKGIAE